MIPYTGRRNFRKSASTIPNKITRESFISPDAVKVALSNETMFDWTEDRQSIEEIPIPESVRAAGVIPEGYAISYHLDPAVTIYALAVGEDKITTIEQLTDSLIANLIQIMNGPDNVTIAPISVVEGKIAAVENSLATEDAAEDAVDDAAQTEKSEETSH